MQIPRPWFAFLVVLALCTFPLGALSSSPTANVVLTTMQAELQRATKSLAKTDPAPYYLSYAVTDADETDVAASNGSVIYSASVDRRMADVMMRVGSIALDDDSSAIARVLWQLTDREYEQASAAFLRVKTSNAVRSEEEDKSPDFSSEAPQDHLNLVPLHPPSDQQIWEARTRNISAGFLKYPDVYSSYVTFNISADRSYLATSEGTALVRPGAIARLIIQAE